jgi:hypothetical protein
MSALAGIGSLAAALYLAARVRGLGPPLEDQPRALSQALSASTQTHSEQAETFLRLSHGIIGRAQFAVLTGSCREAHRLLVAAKEALAHASAHISSLERSSMRRSLQHQLDIQEATFEGLRKIVIERCTS